MSIIGLYGVPGIANKRYTHTTNKAVLTKSWEMYTKEVVTSANPDRVICIGNNVLEVIKSNENNFLKKRIDTQQPNGIRTKNFDSLSYFKKFYQWCNY